MTISRPVSVLIFGLTLAGVALIFSPFAVNAQANPNFFAAHEDSFTDNSPQQSASDCNSDGSLKYSGKPDLIDYIESGQLSFSDFSKNIDQAQITVVNMSDCYLPITMGAYEMRAADLQSQELHDSDTTIIASGDSATLKSDLPESGQCTTEIDVMHGTLAPERFENENFFARNLMANTFWGDAHDEFEENDALSDGSDDYNDVEPINRFCEYGDPAPLSFNCSVPEEASINETVEWRVENLSGGDGNYEFSWTGNADGTNHIVTENYTSPGLKTATVTVSAGNQDKAASCTIDVKTETDDTDSDFTLAINGGMWTISGANLPSSPANISLSREAGFSENVTLTAFSPSVLSNESTYFQVGADSPQKTVTIEVGDTRPISLYVHEAFPAGTYPVTVFAQTSSNTETAETSLHAQNIFEM